MSIGVCVLLLVRKYSRFLKLVVIEVVISEIGLWSDLVFRHTLTWRFDFRVIELLDCRISEIMLFLPVNSVFSS